MELLRDFWMSSPLNCEVAIGGSPANILEKVTETTSNILTFTYRHTDVTTGSEDSFTKQDDGSWSRSNEIGEDLN